MQKKNVCAAAAMVLAGAMCLGFAACGTENAEDMKSEQVTAEVWAAALSEEAFTNYKLDVNMEYIVKKDGAETAKTVQTYLITVADGNAYGKITYVYSGNDIREDDDGNPVTEETEENYEETTNTGNFRYEKDEAGKWSKEETSHVYLSTIVLNYCALKNEYDKFEYNEEKQGYTVKSEFQEDLGFSGIVMKFKGGKLVAVIQSDERESSNNVRVSTGSFVITYGGQKVTLPTIE